MSVHFVLDNWRRILTKKGIWRLVSLKKRMVAAFGWTNKNDNDTNNNIVFKTFWWRKINNLHNSTCIEITLFFYAQWQYFWYFCEWKVTILKWKSRYKNWCLSYWCLRGNKGRKNRKVFCVQMHFMQIWLLEIINLWDIWHCLTRFFMFHNKYVFFFFIWNIGSQTIISIWIFMIIVYDEIWSITWFIQTFHILFPF